MVEHNQHRHIDHRVTCEQFHCHSSDHSKPASGFTRAMQWTNGGSQNARQISMSIRVPAQLMRTIQAPVKPCSLRGNFIRWNPETELYGIGDKGEE